MAQRIFIALLLHPEIRDQAVAWQNTHADLPVRWIAPKNLHITLVPPWQADNADPVIEVLKSMETTTPFPIELSNITFGPNPRAPRLIWAAGPTPPELLSLKQRAEGLLGFPSDPRAFKVHATLARFSPEDYARFPVKHMDDPIAWQQTVNSAVIMRSHLTSDGADYEVLAEIKFC